MATQEITYVPAKLEFDAFAAHKKKAMEVAEYIRSIELTEDNVKEVKGTLADARKLVNALEDRRKDIKRQVMAPYQVFEKQVKEITSIIDQADADLRSQLRQMEERERDAKKQQLQELWELRITHYSFPQYVPDAFDRWLTPQHLNKTMTMKVCEQSMTEFMERLQLDTNVILHMEDAVDVMAEYASSLDMTGALDAVRRQKEYKARAFQEQAPAAESATFVITGKASIALAEKLFAEHGIEYRRI